MPLKKVVDGSMIGEDSPFSVSPIELEEIMENESVQFLNQKFGGVSRIVELLKSNAKDGISEADEISFDIRKEYFGENVYPLPPMKSIFKMFLEALNDTLIIILLVFAVFSIALGLAFPEGGDRRFGWVEGFTILVAVFIVASVGAGNNYFKERKFRSLNKESKKIPISVTRNGAQIEVLIHELHVGDIVNLRQGDQVPADGLFLTGFDLKVDEAAVTGETELIKKGKNDPFLKSGTEINEGTGDMIVIAVGLHSQWGKALALISGKWAFKKENEKKEEDMTKEELQKKKEAEDDRTPLEIKLDSLAGTIGKIGISSGVFVTSVLFIGWIIRKTLDVHRGNVEWSAKDVLQIVNFVLIGVTVAVVSVPEGLPLAVTISLAFSVREMLKDKNLVRHLAACETMGGVTNICSDKTGTLTLNQMNVVKGWFGGRNYDDQIASLATTLHSDVAHLLIEGVVVNSKATVLDNTEEVKEDKSLLQRLKEKIGIKKGKKQSEEKEEKARYKVVGSKTEGALLLLLIKQFGKPTKWAEEQLKQYRNDHIIAHQFTFSSQRKRMTTIIRLHPEFDKDSPTVPDLTQTALFKYRLYCKGASEIVLEDCTGFLNENGTVEALDERKKKELMETINTFANQGLRTLCLAYRDFSQYYSPSSVKIAFHERDAEYIQDPREVNFFQSVREEDLEKDLICVAIVGIKDPLREEVKDAVRMCKRAGIRIRMITGDNLLTAKHIARECGILTDKGIAIEGPEFRKLRPEEVRKLLPRLEVMARSSPADKYNLVNALREEGEVVAVTGDGTNDAPALKTADVGLSMGLSGTQVAKEASDIIIMDDNFFSIVQSVKWGRCVFENIRKFLLFQITVNGVALLLTIVTAIVSIIIGEKGSDGIMRYKPPMTPVQLLWVNLIMDTFAAIALATEKPFEGLLERKPYGRKESLISARMWIFTIIMSTYQFVLLMVLYYAGESMGLFNKSPKNKVDGLNRTLVFNTFVLCQSFNQFNCRKINLEYNVFAGCFKNPMIWLITAITVGLQAVFVNIESRFTQTYRLNGYHWLISLGFGFLSLPLAALAKLMVNPILNCITKEKGKENNWKDQETGCSTDAEDSPRTETSHLELTTPLQAVGPTIPVPKRMFVNN